MRVRQSNVGKAFGTVPGTHIYVSFYLGSTYFQEIPFFSEEHSDFCFVKLGPSFITCKIGPVCVCLVVDNRN